MSSLLDCHLDARPRACSAPARYGIAADYEERESQYGTLHSTKRNDHSDSSEATGRKTKRQLQRHGERSLALLEEGYEGDCDAEVDEDDDDNVDIEDKAEDVETIPSPTSASAWTSTSQQNDTSPPSSVSSDAVLSSDSDSTTLSWLLTCRKGVPWLSGTEARRQVAKRKEAAAASAAARRRLTSTDGVPFLSCAEARRQVQVKQAWGIVPRIDKKPKIGSSDSILRLDGGAGYLVIKNGNQRCRFLRQWFRNLVSPPPEGSFEAAQAMFFQRPNRPWKARRRGIWGRLFTF